MIKYQITYLMFVKHVSKIVMVLFNIPIFWFLRGISLELKFEKENIRIYLDNKIRN